MMVAMVIWESPHWWPLALAAALLALGVLVWGYRRAPYPLSVRIPAALLKTAGIVLLALCLMEPLFNGTRARPGANLFVVLADNSSSMQIRDKGRAESRGELLRQTLDRKQGWWARLGQDFDVRSYRFDTQLQLEEDLTALDLEGPGTALATALQSMARRYHERPLAGVLLFTDGNATDMEGQTIDWTDLPPIYPVVIGAAEPERDLQVSRIAVSQTSFEVAPVTINAAVLAPGFGGEPITATLVDDAGETVETRTISVDADDKPLAVRFKLKPERSGVHFYRLRLAPSDQTASGATAPEEASLANNERLVTVHRERGPYRILYVSGRPNWEFKFLQRALEADTEVELVGLIRIANREPKFDYRSRTGESTNPLYRGFGNQQDEEAEQYDQPVLLRLQTRTPEELQDGFPKTADQLFAYHAIVVDDLEAAFFTHDQLTLIQNFVRRRGGGFLMLGGQESFRNGKYQRTPIDEILPVYLDQLPPAAPGTRYRFTLSREGWLHPWARLRPTEEEEHRRLEAMPPFHTLNRVRGIKPGATVLAIATAESNQALPALVAQRFGRGRTATLHVGDLWRWNLRRENPEKNDSEVAWRQLIRWLVSDIPRRIEVELERDSSSPDRPVRLAVRLLDEEFEALDNATVAMKVTLPDGNEIELSAESSDREAGLYTTSFVPRLAGSYRAHIHALAADGSELGTQETGWTAEPAVIEHRTLTPNRTLLERLARDTGGELIDLAGLEKLVASLPHRRAPLTEAWIFPLWQHWLVFVFAIACLVGEWGLRRWKGLP